MPRLLNDFRCEVLRRAADRHGWFIALGYNLGESEVCELDIACFINQHVFRFETKWIQSLLSVDDILVVECLEGQQYLAGIKLGSKLLHKHTVPLRWSRGCGATRTTHRPGSTPARSRASWRPGRSSASSSRTDGWGRPAHPAQSWYAPIAFSQRWTSFSGSSWRRSSRFFWAAPTGLSHTYPSRLLLVGWSLILRGSSFIIL
jgi:hypothetical protein